MGETIFDYLEQGGTLQKRIDAISLAEDEDRAEETTQHRLRDVTGQFKDVEITLLLASRADGKPMFTAIIREIER